LDEESLKEPVKLEGEKDVTGSCDHLMYS